MGVIFQTTVSRVNQRQFDQKDILITCTTFYRNLQETKIVVSPIRGQLFFFYKTTTTTTTTKTTTINYCNTGWKPAFSYWEPACLSRKQGHHYRL